MVTTSFQKTDVIHARTRGAYSYVSTLADTQYIASI